MAQQLGQVAVGSIVKLNENGSPINYLVVHQGLPSSKYDVSCNGTWVRRQDIYQNRRWTTNNVNAYAGSSINTYLNGTFLNVFQEDIRAAIKQVKIPYLPLGNGSNLISGADGLSCKIFLLSGAEVGFNRNSSVFYDEQSLDGNKLSYFSDSSARDKRIATLNDEPSPYWLRTPSDSNTTGVGTVKPDGSADTTPCSWTDVGVLPAFVLPSNLTVSDDGSVSTAPLPPSAIDVPQAAMQGNQISVSWTEVDGADGYILERKADNGGWTQVYSGANTSYEDTAGTWTTVQYRVKAGLEGTYGDYTTSAVISVVIASALEISGTDGDLGTLIDDVSYIVFSDGTGALTVTETINGVSRTYTAVNGAANKISVLDLPTGSGTIKISASTDPGSGVVTVTREWTYTKAAITFPGAGSVADLIHSGQTIWAKTIAEAVRMSGGMTLDRFIAATVITLTAAAWTQSGGVYTQTVDCPIVWPYAPIVIVEPDLTTEDQSADDAVLTAWQSGPGAKGIKQGDGEITFYSASQPTMNIPVRVGVI